MSRTYNPPQVMRVLIAGSGRVGREVAQALSALGDDVSVLDESEEAIDALGRTFDGTVHVGVTYDVDALRAAGIEEADIFLALTPSDNANLMAVQLAERVFGVPRAIARLDDPAREAAYRALAVDFVPTARLTARVLVERVHEPEFAYHLAFSGGDVQVVEMVLGAGAAGSSVADLEIEGELRVAALQRDGIIIIPRSGDPLRPGDLVAAAVRRGVAGRVRRFLASVDEAGGEP
jgi:trk system potassium uptake protein TrkA